MLEGEISIGDRLIWQPDVPSAYERIQVMTIRDRGGETWIWTEGKTGLYGNSEFRLREACIRDATAASNSETGEREKGREDALPEQWKSEQE